MTTTRQEIIGIIENAAQGTDLAHATWYDTRTRKETPVIEDTTERILAAVHDAALDELLAEFGGEDEHLRVRFTRALRAAGITKGEGDEG